MSRRQWSVRLRPPGPFSRWVYRRCRADLPIAASPLHAAEILAAVLPHTWRRVHHWLAVRGDYFWLPCPLCGIEFGGHETAGILWDQDGAGGGRSICRDCTERRRMMG